MAINPSVAAVMIAVVIQPSHRSSGGLTRLPITLGSLVRMTTRQIRGGASTPLTTAAPKSIATAFKSTPIVAARAEVRLLVLHRPKIVQGPLQ